MIAVLVLGGAMVTLWYLEKVDGNAQVATAL